MEQQQIFMMLPGLQQDEYYFIKNVMKNMNESEQQQFIMFYQGKRKDYQTLLILTIIGFFGVAGIQRFVTGEIGLGILYLITLGFCGIGTIIDIIILKRITFDYNQKQAMETANMMRITS